MLPQWVDWLKLLLPIVVTIQIYAQQERKKNHNENVERLDSIDNRFRELNGSVKEHAYIIRRNSDDIAGIMNRERERWGRE